MPAHQPPGSALPRLSHGDRGLQLWKEGCYMEDRERQMQEVTLQLVQQAPHVELRVTEKMLRGIPRPPLSLAGKNIVID